MTTSSLADQQARNRIIADLTSTIMVEAGAGSGKTTCLVARMAALVASGHCPIENLAAITFTRKAAAELGSRFQLELEAQLRRAADPALRQRLQYSLDNLHRAFLGTIHSFCSRLLRERPVEAGFSPDFREIEGLEETLLQERAWQDYLNRARLQDPALFHTLTELDIRPQDLRDTYRELCLYPDVDIAVADCPYPRLDGIRDDLADFVKLYRPYLPDEEPDKGWDNLQRNLRRYLAWDKRFDLDKDKYLLRLLAQMDNSGSVTLNRWTDKQMAKQAKEAWPILRQTCIAPTLQAWREYRHKPLMDFLLPAVHHYHKLRLGAQRLNFQDLLMESAALLRHSPEVRRYFQQRFTHLLVDEFQDTDPIQAEVMMLLSATDPAENTWQRAVPRPGSLFVVGDPKQSIYRFRRADISVYEQVKAQIVATGGTVLHLSTNFRSLQNLIDYANHTFDPLFADEAPPRQALCVPMHAHRPPGGQETLARIAVPDVHGNHAGKVAAADAELVASAIRSLILSPGSQVKPEHCLILLRKKSRMSEYARALETYKIPYNISGAANIGESAELRDLCLLLTALADPADSLALVAALRSALFGLSDAALYAHRQAGGHFSLFAPVPDHPYSDEISYALNLMQHLHTLVTSLSPAAAAEAVIAELALLPRALNSTLARGNASYVLQAVELLRNHEQQGNTTLKSAARFLTALLETGVEEELDVDALRRPGVRIMNLHRAKGLEADHVFLAHPHQGGARGASLHISRPLTGPPVGYLAVTQSRGDNRPRAVLAQPPGWDQFLAEEDRYLQAEETRLLYVAATRARDRLHISGYAKAENKKNPWRVLVNEHITNVMDSPPAPPPSPPLLVQPLTAAEYDAAAAAITAARAHTQQPTYRETTVTAEAKFGEVRRQSTGKGVTWGNVIHRALELTAQKHILTHSALELLLEQQGRPRSEAAELAALLAAIHTAPFWQRILQASEVHTELPFGTVQGSDRLQGVIDIAFREPDGWVLADFKSDHIIDDAHLQELTDFYRPQISAYAAQFTALTWEKVKECGLLFTERAGYVRV